MLTSVWASRSLVGSSAMSMLGLVHKRPGYGHPTGLAARELPGEGVHAVAEAHQLEQLAWPSCDASEALPLPPNIAGTATFSSTLREGSMLAA